MLSSNKGPPCKVSFGGQKIESLSFYAMTFLGCYFGILSYDGNVSVGVSMDAALGEASQVKNPLRFLRTFVESGDHVNIFEIEHTCG